MERGLLKFCLAAVLVVVVSGTVAAATGFSVDVTSSETTVDPAERDSTQFDIQVTNTGNERRVFWVTYNTGTASSPSWYGLTRDAVVVEANGSADTTLTVTPDPSAMVGNFGPEIVVYPLDDPSNRFSQFATFTISRDDRLFIDDYTDIQPSYDPGERLSLQVSVKNVVQQEIPANQFQLVLELGDRERRVSVPALDPGEVEDVEVGLGLEDMRAGIYDMSIRVVDVDGGVHSESTARVQVNAVESSHSKVTTESTGILSSRSVASVTNTGNTDLTEVEVSSQTPWYVSPFVSFDERPDEVVSNQANDVYVWYVESLKPDESVSYSYQVSYWPIPVVVVILLVVAGVLISQYRRMTVVKRVKRSGDSFTVHLRVKNGTGHEVDDVAVEDFVPGIAMLVRKFDSRKPDKIRNTEEGTEVAWEFGSMEPDEERIVTYTLRPRIRVEGNVSLPEAIVEYTRDETVYSATSHPVSADFRE